MPFTESQRKKIYKSCNSNHSTSLGNSRDQSYETDFAWDSEVDNKYMTKVNSPPMCFVGRKLKRPSVLYNLRNYV